MPRPVTLLVAGLLGSGLLMLYAEPLAAMVSVWNASPMYSYAFTVPPISLYLLWSRRRALAGQPVRPNRVAGGAVFAGALVMLALGEAAAVQIAAQLSFLVALAGVVLFLFGAGHLRICAPALGYLLFMVPFWEVFTEPLHWPFRNNSATLGVAILHAAGIPAYRDGTLIALSNVTLEVARACSGVNYLIAVLALALPLSFLRLRGVWRRLLLIGSALVIAALANGVRVALIGALAYFEIGSPLHGPFHVLHGLFVAGVGYVALFAGLHLLETAETAAAGGREATGPPSSRWEPRAAALAAVCWALAVVGTSPGSTPVALAMPLESLPGALGAWQADDSRDVLQPVAAWSEADTQIERRYFRQAGEFATVQVWYFEAQRQNREVVNFKAAGLHQQAVRRRVAVPGGSAFTANVVRLPGEVGLFWYVLDGAAEPDQYAAKLRSLWTAVTAGRSNGAAVMLRARAAGVADEAVLATLDDLAAEIHVALGRHWGEAAPPPAGSPSEAK